MYNNKSTAMLFTEIYDAFFQGYEDYYIQYYDDKGDFRLSSREGGAVPTYMIYNKIGEVVIADSGLDVLEVPHNDNVNNDIDIGFENSTRIKKIGILLRRNQSDILNVQWIAIEDTGVIQSVNQGRDLHKDLSLIAKRIGIKADKVRIA